MKSIVFTCLFAVALAAPQYSGDPKDAQVLRDDRVHPEGGAYSFDFETENGIKVSEGGQPEGDAQAIVSSGTIEYPLPDGGTFSLKYVADEFGYKPESDFLPVAPEFPHPIPQFVLDQIAFGEQQRAERARNSQ